MHHLDKQYNTFLLHDLDYLTDYQIKTIKKETKEETLNRVNNLEKQIQRFNWDVMHWGKIKLIIYKNGENIQELNFDEMNTADGFSFIEIKSISTELQRLYQDYESKLETKIIFTDEWDETPTPKNN